MATQRFLTVEQGVEHLLKETPPLHFEWYRQDRMGKMARRTFLRNLIEDLGPSPEALPLEVETLEQIQFDGYTREKIIFNPDPFSSIPAYVLNPRRGNR